MFASLPGLLSSFCIKYQTLVFYNVQFMAWFFLVLLRITAIKKPGIGPESLAPFNPSAWFSFELGIPDYTSWQIQIYFA